MRYNADIRSGLTVNVIKPASAKAGAKLPVVVVRYFISIWCLSDIDIGLVSVDLWR